MPKRLNYSLQDYKEKLHQIWNDKIKFQFDDYHYSETNVYCTCEKNHHWKTKIYTLLKGHGCLQCSGKKQLTQQQAEKRLKQRSNQFSFYPFIYKNIRTKITCKCNKCNNTWQTCFTHLIGNNKTGCPHCRRSRGEQNIQEFLIKNNIEYIPQKMFDGCKGKRKKLIFDFYLPKYNICVQIQGIQHFKATKRFGGIKSFQILQKYDRIKRLFCNKNKIQLLYIGNKAKTEEADFCLTQKQFEQRIYKIIKEFEIMENKEEKKIQPPQNHIKVLDNDFGWVGLLNCMGNETTIVNAARISFQNISPTFEEKDERLLKYLIRNKHTTPLEHVVFTFSVHCPLYVRSQWMRHRTWAFNEISRRYTEADIEFYIPKYFRKQSENNKQASTNEIIEKNEEAINETEKLCLKTYHWYLKLIEMGVCREQARGVLPQCMMTTFWATVNLHNLIHFIELRDDEHAQKEIREYAKAMKELVRPIVPHVIEYFESK